MADFTEQQKQFVIRCWASDMDSDEIAKEFVDSFSTEELSIERPTTAQLARYNPKYASCSLSPAHRELYHKARKAFQEDLSAIPIAHRAYRLRELLTLYKKQKKKSDVIAADLLEQAAREMGGMFEQRQPSGASPKEVADYIREKLVPVRAAIETLVTDPEVKKNVLDQIEGAERVEG